MNKKHLPMKNADYQTWIEQISLRFKNSQIKAAIKVNDEMLRFYWQLGKEIAERKELASIGDRFFKKLSQDLKNLLPTVKSFSPTNLRYMQYFYELYPNPQLVDNEIALFSIPWGHHRFIIDKCRNNQEKALFYIQKTLENSWSRAVLLNFLDSDLYSREGKAISNFANTLPKPQSDLAQAITKDPYNFDFLTIRERYDEKELKDALMANTEKFLLELGKGFAFVGREVRIEIGDSENFIDLLFYHTKLHCYVVVEVKVNKFEAQNMGQLGTYIVAVNHQFKTPEDKPTLGLLVCKSMNKVEAQYALEATNQPIGISSYELSQLIPDDYQKSLPTIEEIEAEFS